jgi:hypothetical protein
LPSTSALTTLVVLGVGAWIAYQMWPDLVRYLKIQRM